MMLNYRNDQKKLPLQKSSKKLHDIVLDHPKGKVRELAEAAGISMWSVIKILHKGLGMRKLIEK